MKVTEALENGFVPMIYKGIIPEKCSCGSDLELSDTLTKLWCPNVRCYKKQVARMTKMLTNFGVKDIGLAYCKSLYDSMKEYFNSDSVSYVKVFQLPYSAYPNTFSDSVTLNRFNEIQRVVRESFESYSYSFPNLVSNLAIPDMSETAKKVCKGFDSIEAMIEHIDKEYDKDVTWYMKDIVGGDIQAGKLAKSLRDFAVEIKTAEDIFNIRKAVDKTIRIAITGRVFRAGRYTRNDFVKHCNAICEGVLDIQEGGVSSATKYVVADEPSENNKYLYGEAMGILIHSDDFIKLLEEEVSS